MVSGAEAYFQEGMRTLYLCCLLCGKAFGANRREGGCGKRRILSISL